MDDAQKTRKMLSYWEKLEQNINEQEQEKTKTINGKSLKKFDKLNKKILAINYLFTLLEFQVPYNIYQPFRKLSVEIGKSKGTTLKKKGHSKKFEITSRISIKGRKIKTLERRVDRVVNKIINDGLFLRQIRKRCVLNYICSQLEYDYWIQPMVRLYKTLGLLRWRPNANKTKKNGYKSKKWLKKKKKKKFNLRKFAK